MARVRTVDVIEKLWRVRVYIADQHFLGDGLWDSVAGLEAFRIVNKAMNEIKEARRNEA